jgi:hypothetical protein
MFKFIQDYGISLVICAVFIYAAYHLINIGLDYLKAKLGIKSEQEQKKFNKKIEVDYNIQLILTKILAETGGNRITIMEYHDHIRNMWDISSYYMTCIYEVYKTGLSPVSNKLDKIPTSLVSKFLLELREKPYVIVDSSAGELPKEEHILLIAQNERRALCVALKDMQGGAIGYVALKKDGEFTGFDISVMKDVSIKIGSMMSMFKKEAG